MNRESSYTISHSMRCKAPRANELLRFKMEKMLPVVDFISIENYGGKKYRWTEKNNKAKSCSFGPSVVLKKDDLEPTLSLKTF